MNVLVVKSYSTIVICILSVVYIVILILCQLFVYQCNVCRETTGYILVFEVVVVNAS